MADRQALYLAQKPLEAALCEDWTAIRDLGYAFHWTRPVCGAVGGLAVIIITPLPNAAAAGPMGLFFMLIGAGLGSFWEMLNMRKLLRHSIQRITTALEDDPCLQITPGKRRHTRQVSHRDFRLHCRWETAELLRQMVGAEAQFQGLMESDLAVRPETPKASTSEPSSAPPPQTDASGD